MSQKWLVLGGTKEARDFISHWQNDRQIQIVLSLTQVSHRTHLIFMFKRVLAAFHPSKMMAQK